MNASAGRRGLCSGRQAAPDEPGAGHRVTALYEIVPAQANLAGVDPLKYQRVEVGARKDSRTSDDEGARRDSRTSEDRDSRTSEETDSHTGEVDHSDELLTVKLRYKQPDGDVSTLIEAPLNVSTTVSFEGASVDTRFAASVAGFGMLLRNSPHKGELTYDAVINMAVGAMGNDASGQRAEFIDLVRKAQTLSNRK